MGPNTKNIKVAIPFAPSSFLLLVVRPGAPSSVLAALKNALFHSQALTPDCGRPKHHGSGGRILRWSSSLQGILVFTTKAKTPSRGRMRDDLQGFGHVAEGMTQSQQSGFMAFHDPTGSKSSPRDHRRDRHASETLCSVKVVFKHLRLLCDSNDSDHLLALFSRILQGAPEVNFKRRWPQVEASHPQVATSRYISRIKT